MYDLHCIILLTLEFAVTTKFPAADMSRYPGNINHGISEMMVHFWNKSTDYSEMIGVANTCWCQVLKGKDVINNHNLSSP